MTDFIPVLSDGAHESPSEGACIMEMVSFLSGDSWTDMPACSYNAISLIAQHVNDTLPDKERHRILSQFNRLFDTAGIGAEPEERFVEALDVYCASRPAIYAKYRGIDGLRDTDSKLHYMIDFLHNYLFDLLRHQKFEGLVGVLSDVLDIADEVLGRERVEKVDMSPLAEVLT